MFFKYVKYLDVPIISLRREAWDYIMWLYKINVREFRRGNQKWIIQRYWQHRVHNKQDEENKTKTQPNKCWTPLCANKNTNNVNRTWAIIQTTGGKDELNHHFCVEIVTDITTLKCERKDRRVCCWCIFLLEVLIYPLCLMIVQLDFGTVLTMWQLLFFIWFQ
jgi:hypothetical protein